MNKLSDELMDKDSHAYKDKRIKELEEVITEATRFFGECMNNGSEPDPQEWFEVFVKALTGEASDD